MHPLFQSALGGVLIGLASWLVLAALGRIAGVSGIISGLMPERNASTAGLAAGWRWAFAFGLVGGGALASLAVQSVATSPRPWYLLIPAGLLVGYGTVLGSGCTSGHGVCGLGRRSARSLVATVTFMAAGVVTVFITSWIR